MDCPSRSSAGMHGPIAAALTSLYQPPVEGDEDIHVDIEKYVRIPSCNHMRGRRERAA